MIYLLLQNSPCIKDLSADLVKDYPVSSVLNIKGVEFPRRISSLTDKWICIVNLYGGMFMNKLEAAKNIEDMSHFIFISSDGSGRVQELLSTVFSNYTVINNLKPSKADMYNYINAGLNLPPSLVDFILSKSKYYEPSVIKNVKTISLLSNEELTRKDLEKYLGDKETVSFMYLYKYILLKEGEWKPVMYLIYRYHDNTDYLTRYIIKSLKRDIEFFHSILAGDLSMDNYITYVAANKLSLYQVQHALNLFSKITIESLMIKSYVFERLIGKNSSEFIMKGCKI